jgi:hypothetical protein
MEKKKTKPIDLNNQVHSEFETSVGNSFNIVREETLKRTKQMDDEGTLNELPDEEDVAKGQGEEPLKSS